MLVASGTASKACFKCCAEPDQVFMATNSSPALPAWQLALPGCSDEGVRPGLASVKAAKALWARRVVHERQRVCGGRIRFQRLVMPCKHSWAM